MLIFSILHCCTQNEEIDVCVHILFSMEWSEIASRDKVHDWSLILSSRVMNFNLLYVTCYDNKSERMQ